jgi:molybdopterin molybdotransferase
MLTTVKKATEIILNQTENLGVEKIPFIDSVNRVLKENIIADRDFPPFNRVSMDGIAISFEVFKKGLREFKIEGIQAAGSSQLSLKDASNCIEAMTGAILPKNTDAVIPYELIHIENGIATIQIDEIKHFQNIHKKGKDKKKLDLIIKKNKLISSADIGVLATVGKDNVLVAKQPKVMIISTGDELVEVNQKPEVYQIRRSNVYTLVSLLKKLNIDTDNIHITDDKAQLKTKIKEILTNYDVLLFSGAVSKGKYDFVPEILDELGVEKLFHRVSQRPGKPFWFGKKEETTIFAFPGNPVSTFVSCLRYFYPWYKKSVELPYQNNKFAVLNEDYIFKPDLTYFLQVKLNNNNGTIFATPITGNGSGDLANLASVDAFLELPKGKSEFLKGEAFPILEFRL